MYYVYIVQCRDGTLYTGTAKNIEARIVQHNRGKGARYTRGRQPVTLVYSELFETWGEVLRRENEIKKWPRSRKMALMGKELSKSPLFCHSDPHKYRRRRIWGREVNHKYLFII